MFEQQGCKGASFVDTMDLHVHQGTSKIKRKNCGCCQQEETNDGMLPMFLLCQHEICQR